jgi:hypothetical protein
MVSTKRFPPFVGHTKLGTDEFPIRERGHHLLFGSSAFPGDENFAVLFLGSILPYAPVGHNFHVCSKPCTDPGIHTSSRPTSFGSLSSRSATNRECRRWPTYASYCTSSWREPLNHGPKTAPVSTRRNDSTTFERCMPIPPKSTGVIWMAMNRASGKGAYYDLSGLRDLAAQCGCLSLFPAPKTA